jgi:5'-nucleotidase
MARWATEELRRQGAEVVVALTHIGYQKDIEIAEKVPGIDVIFGGHSHEYLTEPVVIGETVVVNGGEKGIFLVRLDLAIDAHGNLEPQGTRHQLIPVTNKVVPARDVEALLVKYQESFPEAVVLGRTEVEWNLTKEALRKGESAVANLVNDLMREKFKVEIVLNNGGAFRGKKIYEPGPLTDAMLKEIDEFGNYAFTLIIKGCYIKEILERSAACFGQGGLLHPSGMRYKVDLRERAQKIHLDETGDWTVEQAGQRVKDIQVLSTKGAWVSLDPDKSYRVLSNSFLVESQGDGYFWFQKYGQKLTNTYSTFYSILCEFVENQGVINPGDPDGRLAVISE